MLERYEEAVEKFQKSIEINPNNESTWSYYGYALLKLGKHSQVIEEFQKSIKINPKQSTLVNLIITLIKMFQLHENDDWVDLTVGEFIEAFLEYFSLAVASGLDDPIMNDWANRLDEIENLLYDIDRAILNQPIVGFLNLTIIYCTDCDYLFNPIGRYCFMCGRTEA